MSIKVEDVTICTSSGAIRDTLKCLFFHGPTWDGNVPSKQARDGLCRIGLVHHEFGFAFLTRDGVEMCVNLGLDREKEKWERDGRRPYQGA
jgi:hypothetical protein